MNELTKREQIALAMLKEYGLSLNAEIETHTKLIIKAFTFADLFLSISEDKAGKSISEMENLEARR